MSVIDPIASDYRQGELAQNTGQSESTALSALSDLDEDAGFQLTVASDGAGQRLDRWLAAQLPDVSRSRIQGWIEDGCVTLEGIAPGAKFGPNLRLGAGDVVLVNPPLAQEQTAFAAEDIDINVVFEDDSVIVVDKVAGLVVHPAAGNWSGTLLNALLHRFPELAQVPRAGIVHRLDKDTSGLMVVARSHAAQFSLTEQIKVRSVSRKYLAITCRTPHPPIGTVDAPVGRDPRNRLRMAVVPSGKPAVTHYQTLGTGLQSRALVQCTLETGRTHQIRVHMASLNAPLLGDVLYGAPPSPIIARQALHAWQLVFAHPRSGAPCAFESSLPDDMQQALTVLGLKHA
jgi:23S rRNA pseudouridine1911/1915/1917 synthase